MLNVDDGGARRPHRARGASGGGAGEGDASKVSKGDERAARRKVLDDPLGVQLLERLALAGEGVGDGCSLGVVLDRGGAGARRGCGDRDGDAVTGGDGDAGEVVARSGSAFDA